MEFSVVIGLVTLITDLATKFMAEVQRSDAYTPEQKAMVRQTMENTFAGDAWKVHGNLTDIAAALKTITEALAPPTVPPTK